MKKYIAKFQKEDGTIGQTALYDTPLEAACNIVGKAQEGVYRVESVEV